MAGSSEGKRKRKREYNRYTPQQRAEIAEYARVHGNTKAAKHFSEKLNMCIDESSVRNMKKQLVKRLKFDGADTVESLPTEQRGRPTFLGEHEEDILKYVTSLRESGGIVNVSIMQSAVRGIIMHKEKCLLAEFGGSLVINRTLAYSLLKRFGLVKRKGTKAARATPANFPILKEEYLARITKLVADHKIPDSLLINWDQTGIKLVPVSEWTMAKKGSNQVAITGLGDKRLITGVLACAASGEVLPPQLLYGGRSDACHPKYKFPVGWDIHHSENHWSNKDTMTRYVDKVIIPHVEMVRERDDLPIKQHAVCIFDVFAAHRNDELVQKLRGKNINAVYVPASCTGDLQPLDAKPSPNQIFKDTLKEEFNDWYSSKITAGLKAGKEVAKIDIDLRMSAIKPVHAMWMVRAFKKLSDSHDKIKSAWHTTGILEAVLASRKLDEWSPWWVIKQTLSTQTMWVGYTVWTYSRIDMC